MDTLRYILQLLLLSMGACLVVIQGGTTLLPNLLTGEDSSGLEQFSSPLGLVQGKQYLYFIDHDQRRILALDPAGKLQLIAGNGSILATGEGGLATQTGMYNIGMAVDSQGNLYLADHGNHRIRRVDPQGRITTVAGTGKAGYGGDNGPATQAQLNSPVAVAVDTLGNLYISDYANHRLRKVNRQGQITTLAGTGKPGFSKEGELAIQANLNSPWGIAVDCKGRIIFTDLGSASVKRIEQNKLTTLADKLGRPTGLAVQCLPRETIYISDIGTNKILAVTGDKIRTIAGAEPTGVGSNALNAQFNAPYSLALDTQGQLLVADTSNNRIQLIDSQGRITTLLAAKP